MFNFRSFNPFKPQTTPLLGLDIDASSIKLTELSLHKNQFCIETYAITPLDYSKEHAISESIKLAIKQSGTTLSHAAIAIPDAEVITKSISLDATLSMDEIEECILANAEKYLHCPLNEINLDFDILGSSTDNKEQNDILLIAARTEHINARIELAEAAGLHISVVDIQSHALERSSHFLMAQNTQYVTKLPTLIIDMGSRAINAIVLYENTVIFSRAEPFILSDIHTPNMILVHIHRILHFFSSSHPHLKITQILLMGEASSLPDISTYIEKLSETPTALANLFPSFSEEEKFMQDSRLMMTSCGLALRNFQL